ncbi:MAG: hypothetical protein HYX57_01020 [Chloroflexi bacterium]|nr:hypothetical protein [Chloroflexota bacterium]
MDHRSLRFPDPAPRASASWRDRIPDALREPVRAAGVGGYVLLAVGALLPWIRATLPGKGTFEISGFENSGDAGLVLEMGTVALLLVWSDRAWRSRLGVLVAGPLALGAANLLVMRIAQTESEAYLATLIPAGGHGSILPAFWVTVAGSLILTTAGAIHVWRTRDRASYNPGITSSAVGGTIGAIAGMIGGFIGGATIANLLTAGAIAGVTTSVLIILAFALAFVGAWIGGTVGASLGRSLRA